MKRLIEKGLMFGGLILVSSPALVERYNRALKQLSGKTTALAEFHIDLSGYAPEIGDELGDERYLNPNGVNRQFILLTTEQKTAPLLNATFSTDKGILRQFIDANEPQLFALTARDAVVGEILDQVFEVSTPDKLLDYRRVTVEADTVGEAVADAGRLHTLIGRFRAEENGWYDAALIGEMIDLARKTGDVVRVPVTLGKPTFEQPDFWTSHFGGVYVFRSIPSATVISVAARETLGDMAVPVQLDLADRNQIAHFLETNALAEPIVTTKGADAAGILRQKMDFVLMDAAAAAGTKLDGLEPGAVRRELRGVAQRLGAAAPAEFAGLAALLRWVEGAAEWPRLTSEHPAYFYGLRARPGPLCDLVTMLLCELCPLDARQMFLGHKELFYQTYATWPEAKRAAVAQYLAQEYLLEKAGAQAAVSAPEAGPWRMADRVAQVGPWGAVRRERG